VLSVFYRTLSPVRIGRTGGAFSRCWRSLSARAQKGPDSAYARSSKTLSGALRESIGRQLTERQFTGRRVRSWLAGSAGVGERTQALCVRSFLCCIWCELNSSALFSDSWRSTNNVEQGRHVAAYERPNAWGSVPGQPVRHSSQCAVSPLKCLTALFRWGLDK
jgi:hypothetical protein